MKSGSGILAILLLSIMRISTASPSWAIDFSPLLPDGCAPINAVTADAQPTPLCRSAALFKEKSDESSDPSSKAQWLTKTVVALRDSRDFRQSIILGVRFLQTTGTDAAPKDAENLRLETLRSVHAAQTSMKPGISSSWAGYGLGFRDSDIPGADWLKFDSFESDYPDSPALGEVQQMQNQMAATYLENELSIVRLYYGEHKYFATIVRAQSLYQWPVLRKSPDFAEVLYWSARAESDYANDLARDHFWTNMSGLFRKKPLDLELRVQFNIQNGDPVDRIALANSLRTKANGTAQGMKKFFPDSPWTTKALNAVE